MQVFHGNDLASSYDFGFSFVILGDYLGLNYRICAGIVAGRQYGRRIARMGLWRNAEGSDENGHGCAVYR